MRFGGGYPLCPCSQVLRDPDAQQQRGSARTTKNAYNDNLVTQELMTWMPLSIKDHKISHLNRQTAVLNIVLNIEYVDNLISVLVLYKETMTSHIHVTCIVLVPRAF